MTLPCTHGRTKYCPYCSKIKLVVALKNGYNHLKLKKDTDFYNPVYYSYLKYNNRRDDEIMAPMAKRLYVKYGNAVTKLLFYNNLTKMFISSK